MAQAKMNLTVDLDPLKKLVGAFKTSSMQIITQAVVEHAEKVMGWSKQMVPVDTGALRASGRVRVKVSDAGVIAELAYGSASVEYALRVHEDLNAVHRVGNAKYLERPVLESRDIWKKTMADALKRALQDAAERSA